MAINPYFNFFSHESEQDLIQDLIIESIKIYGQEVRYLPRTLVGDDKLFGEVPLSMFSDAIAIEMYIRDVEGFSGEGDIIARYGLQIRDEITFTVARRRWFQEFSENDLVGGDPSFGRLATRPIEGDLIHFPLVNKLFEIRFVEHEAVFYQTGALQTFDLTCELWDYSSERVDTGDISLDDLANQFSLDVLDEPPGGLDNESQSENELIKNSDVLDLSETNPFLPARRSN